MWRPIDDLFTDPDAKTKLVGVKLLCGRWDKYCWLDLCFATLTRVGGALTPARANNTATHFVRAADLPAPLSRRVPTPAVLPAPAQAGLHPLLEALPATLTVLSVDLRQHSPNLSCNPQSASSQVLYYTRPHYSVAKASLLQDIVVSAQLTRGNRDSGDLEVRWQISVQGFVLMGARLDELQLEVLRVFMERQDLELQLRARAIAVLGDQ